MQDPAYILPIARPRWNPLVRLMGKDVVHDVWCTQRDEKILNESKVDTTYHNPMPMDPDDSLQRKYLFHLDDISIA